MYPLNNVLYNLWYWVGCKCWFFREYNIQRDKSMKNARIALEDAFTPQLQKMLNNK